MHTNSCMGHLGPQINRVQHEGRSRITLRVRIHCNGYPRSLGINALHSCLLYNPGVAMCRGRHRGHRVVPDRTQDDAGHVRQCNPLHPLRNPTQKNCRMNLAQPGSPHPELAKVSYDNPALWQCFKRSCSAKGFVRQSAGFCVPSTHLRERVFAATCDWSQRYLVWTWRSFPSPRRLATLLAALLSL